MLKSLTITFALLAAPFATSFAALHHFRIELADKSKVITGHPFDVKITAVDENGQKDTNINQAIKLVVNSPRKENFEENVVLNSGEATVRITMKNREIHILTVTDGAPDKPIFNAITVEAR